MLSAEDSMKYMKNFQDIPSIKEQLQIQSKAVGYSESQKTTSDKLYLCHVTSVFPKKGIILPRMKIKTAIPSTYSFENKKLMSLLFEGLSIVSPTVHFSLNSIAEDHLDHFGFQENSFIILDKIENSKEKISGGYIEDLFCIGSFRLSNEATILMHKNYEGYFREELKHLPDGVQIIYFDTSLQCALEKFLISQGSCSMSLVPRENNGIPAFFGNILSQKISSTEVVKLFGGVFCTFDITPMAMIKELLCAGEMSPVSPYLKILQNEENIHKMNSYIKAMNDLFDLNKNNKLFIEQYPKALINLISFLKNSKNHEEFEQNWVYYEDLITQYDQINLNHKIEETQATKALTYMTGLFFSSYIRDPKSTIVDAVHEVSTQKGNSQGSAEGLRKRFNTHNFFDIKLKNQHHIVFPGVNLPKNQKILSLKY